MNIIMVEDDEDLGEILSMSLTTSGHKVLYARDGVELLKSFRAFTGCHAGRHSHVMDQWH